MHPQLHLPQHWRPLALGTAAVLSVVTWTTWYLHSRRPTPKQLEERRRNLLAAQGRIIDGILVDAHPSESEPAVIFYTYRVAGVRYECSQDIASLPPPTLHLDAPIQVRYSPRNPGNSIVLAESWNGLW